MKRMRKGMRIAILAFAVALMLSLLIGCLWENAKEKNKEIMLTRLHESLESFPALTPAHDYLELYFAADDTQYLS